MCILPIRGNFRIQKFDPTGNFITKWGINAGGPDGVAVDSLGDVYTVNSGTIITFILPPPPMPSVMKFDSDGNPITEWGSLGADDGQFNPPIAIGVDTSGNVYVADTGNKRIQKFDSDGKFFTKWGSAGAGNGEFNLPQGVAVDASGNVYVADTWNNRIQKFSPNGNFINKWGSDGSGDGQFSLPGGVAVDSSGNVYVADTGNNRIQKFDSNGNLITKWGSYGSGNGQFANPLGIAVDSDGYVYVADAGNNRIQKFSLVGQETISAPSTPSGPATGMVGSQYFFSTGGASSDLEHPVEYRFSWGDGTYSDWAASPVASKFWSSAGACSVKAQARCSVDTSVESAWSGTLYVSVSQNDLPDLTGQWNSLAQTCRDTRNGKKCRISGRLSIKNIGNKNAPSSFVRFYLSDDAQYIGGLDIFLKQVATGAVKAGKNMIKTLSYSFPLGETASGKYIIAVIDAGNTVAESNESNNYVVYGPIPATP